jgi:uncharacterized protein Yka (UPF0111/DUF47 family)
MSFLLPKESVFFGHFLKMQGEIEAMSTLFGEFVEEFDRFEDYSKRAHVIEHRADETAHAIIAQLNQSFITPFDRDDIHFLAQELDEIVDRIEDVIRDVHLYHFSSRVDSMKEFAACIREATLYLGKMMRHLKRMKYTPILTKEKIKIHEVEDRADIVFENAMSRLFKKGGDPIEVIKNKALLEEMEEVVDMYQKVSNLIESIIIKGS